LSDVYKNNHKSNKRYKDINEASKAFDDWKEKKLMSKEKEDTYRFVFRGFGKVVRNKKLNSSEVSLYFAIYEEIDANTGICKKPNSYFSEYLSMGKNTLDKALNGLEEKGLIYRSVGYDKNNKILRAICVIPY
jgi:DNA-binding MarR family transcriptional regulator